MVATPIPLIATIGMGYVGLSLAKVVAFAGLPIRGIDSNIEKVSAINGASSPLVDVSAGRWDAGNAKLQSADLLAGCSV